MGSSIFFDFVERFECGFGTLGGWRRAEAVLSHALAPFASNRLLAGEGGFADWFRGWRDSFVRRNRS